MYFAAVWLDLEPSKPFWDVCVCVCFPTSQQQVKLFADPKVVNTLGNPELMEDLQLLFQRLRSQKSPQKRFRKKSMGATWLFLKVGHPQRMVGFFMIVLE